MLPMAGTMGGGIALVLLQAGFVVYLVDVHKPALDKGLQLLRSVLDSYVKRGKMTAAEVSTILQERLRSTQDLRELSSCQLVVEAVVENMKIKQDILRTLNQVTPATSILLSNTSTLSIDDMASVLDPPRRDCFAGWHFFSPAHVMKLVEIVVGRFTSVETVALLQVLTKRIRKIGVVVGNCDGFCGNRLLKPYAAESVLLLVEGNNSIERVDRAFLNFGMVLGPLQMSDLAGNDVGYNIRKERGWVRDEKHRSASSHRPPRYTELADDMVAKLGRLGQKVGKGWYDYNATIGKGRKGLPSAEMTRLVEAYRHPNATVQATDEDEMIQRVFFPLVNEGFKCLEEGIARSPSDIDVVYIFGYGWPGWRGGPMFWADHDVTLPVLLQSLQRFQREFPSTEHYSPSKLLEQCVALGVTVEEYYGQGMAHKTGLLSRL
jgi:3-hydroxyacyl-CoA dehydrogenase